MGTQRKSFGRLAVLLFSLFVGGAFLNEAFVAGQEAENESSTSRTLSRELEVSKLEYHVNTEGGRTILKQDYHNVPEGQRKPWIAASLPENLGKNRYDDLLAYDDTRVVLDALPEDPRSDYINANYVNGYNREREYVATQGPLPNTIGDFWRMVWQLNTHKIVMLANVIEHGETKVEKYWPEKNASYSDIIITKLSENTLGDHVIRTFSLRKMGDSRRRLVKQFHFTGWPDMGVPSDRLSVVALMEQARKYRPHDTTPMIVHCSAGVGRTGTVILMDSMMEKAKAENKVDFLKRLDEMRDQRINVVEKEAQYIFAHEAVNDVFFGNGSAEYLTNISNQYNEIETQDRENFVEDMDDITGMSSGA